MKSRVLLVGGSGFIGLHLAQLLVEHNHQVTIFCRNPPKPAVIKGGEQVSWVKGDIIHKKEIEQAVKGADSIIHLAGVVQAGPKFDPFSDLNVNCTGVLNVLGARKKMNKDAQYIFLGTRAQFGRKNGPIDEKQCQQPISLYGINKATAERYCELYDRAYGLKSVIVRPSIVYGYSLAKDNNYNAITKFVRLAVEDKKFFVNGFGKDIKDLLFVEDLCELLLKIIESGTKEGTFNAGSGVQTKFADIAKQIVKECGSGSYELRDFPEDVSSFELGSFSYDISKVKKAFKWEPKTRMEDGIKKMVAWYKQK